MIVGIDFGSTMTKIVLMDGMEVLDKTQIKRGGDYTEVLKGYDLSKVEKIVIVGTGASFIEGDILGIPTERKEEFEAVVRGGYFLSGLEQCIVVSLGTGTSFIYVNKEERKHLGGTGIGGGLLMALATVRGIEDVRDFLKLAEKGNLENADLLIKDISKFNIDTLYGDVTAANMAKVDLNTSLEDYAAGVCNLVFQNVAVMATFADKAYQTGHAVIMGTLGQCEIAKKDYDMVGDLFQFDFVLPENSAFGVAIGAALLGSVYADQEADYSKR